MLFMLLTSFIIHSTFATENQCSQHYRSNNILEKIALLAKKCTALDKENDELLRILTTLNQTVEGLTEYIKGQQEIVTQLKVDTEQLKTLNQTVEALTESINIQLELNMQLKDENEQLKRTFKNQTIIVMDIRNKFVLLENKTNSIDRIEQTVRALADAEKLPAIGFSVTQNAVHQKYSAAQTVVFDLVLSNDGDAYDIKTGVFSAQRNGQYFFAMSIFTRDSRVWMRMMKNDKIIGRTHSDARAGGSYHDTASTTAVVSLVKGDRVYMEFEEGVGPWDWNIHAGLHNQFSGFFIR